MSNIGFQTIMRRRLEKPDKFPAFFWGGEISRRETA
jgi:hypothetical protein